MKKLFLLVAIVTAITHAVQADITVTMRNTFGCSYPNASTALPSNALVQLIWSVDNAYAAPLEGQIEAPAGDYVLFSGLTTIPGGYNTDMDGSVLYTDANVGNHNIGAGYLYIYIYQDSVPNVGDFYGRSPIVDTTISGTMTNIVNLSPSSKNVLNTYTVGIVPEPSSIALLLIGLGLVGYRKLRF